MHYHGATHVTVHDEGGVEDDILGLGDHVRLLIYRALDRLALASQARVLHL